MHPDVLELRAFYASTLGSVVRPAAGRPHPGALAQRQRGAG